MSKTKSIYLISKAVWYNRYNRPVNIVKARAVLSPHLHLERTDKVVTIFGIQARTRSIQGDL